MKCRLILTGKNDCFTNMAIDEALLSSAIPVLRLYEWDPAGISIGYNQNVEAEVNIDYCEEMGIDIVRRITGGKAVYHDKELTYSFIIPKNLNLVPLDVAESYKVIAEALIHGLRSVGVQAEIKQASDKVATPICFNSTNWHELTVNNKKISGSAQRRIEGVVLQHGSILLDFDAEENVELFITKNEKKTLQALQENITSIQKELGKSIDIKELEKAIIDGFQKKFGFEFVEEELSPEELKEVERLKKEKYQTSSWNLRV